MPRAELPITAAAVLTLFGVAPTVAQQPAQQAAEQVSLVYEREVFIYPAAARRDPFMPLTSQAGLGPRFEELSLHGIIYSATGGSVALLRAGTELFRVRVGDQVGSVRVVEIGAYRVVFAVNDFGQIRQEMLELKQPEGAGG